MLADFLAPLAAVGLAELGDKTQLAVIVLSSKTGSRLRLLAGVMVAFLVVDGVAVLAGSWMTNVVPAGVLKAVSGVLFVAFGLLMLFRWDGGVVGGRAVESPFWSGLTLILVAEWGDKTQLAAGLLATEYNPLMVLAGAVTALGVLSATAIYFGEVVSKRVDRRTLTKVAAVVFIGIGASFLLF